MTRSDLIKALNDKLGSKFGRNIDKYVKAFFDGIKESLVARKKVELRKFGSFTLRERKERLVHDPRTSKKKRIKSKVVPFFRAGKEITSVVNNKTI